MTMISPCFGCKRIFSYNPHRVPSIPIDPVTGLPPDMGGNPERAERQPICLSCVTYANWQRRKAGKEEIPVHSDAYEATETL